MRRCHGCMREYRKEFDVCPHCGYIVDTAPKIKSHLAGGTILAERYMLGKVLGHGGFGITYIAWDKKLNRTVAIKEFFPNALSTRSEGETQVSCYDDKASRFFQDGVKKMLDEGKRLSKFTNNDNIVNVYDCFEENNTAYIVMEYLDGGDLKKYIEEKGGKLSPEEAVEKILPVLNALEDMHKESLIHRDISPDNIFLCKNGKIKLLDFGSARLAIEDSDKSLSVMVKRGYAPKEQYMSRSKQGPWTDVYAVCATLYKMITGTLPTESTERDEEPLKKFSEFGINSPDLEKVIFKGLEVNIGDRIQSIAELRNGLTKSNQKKPAPVAEPPKKADVPKVSASSEKQEKPAGTKKPAFKFDYKILLAVAAVVVFCVGIVFGIKALKSKPDTSEADTKGSSSVVTTEATTKQSVEVVHKIYESFLETAEAKRYFEVTPAFSDYYTDYEEYNTYVNSIYSIRKTTDYFDLDGDGTDECILGVCFYADALDHYVYYIFDVDGENVRCVDSATYLYGNHRSLHRLQIYQLDGEYYIRKFYSDPHGKAGSVYRYNGESLIFVESYEAYEHYIQNNSETEWKFFFSDTYNLFDWNAPNYLSFEYDEKFIADYKLKEVDEYTYDNFQLKCDNNEVYYLSEEGKEQEEVLAVTSETTSVVPTEVTSLEEGLIEQNVYEYDLVGTCGDNLEWGVDWDKAHMDIWGEGKLEDGISGTLFWYTNEDGKTDMLSTEDLTKIKTMTIHEGVTEIGNYSLCLFENLESLVLPDSLVRIGNLAIDGQYLTTLELPKNLKTIGNMALSSCANLKSITIPKSVTKIGMGAMPYGPDSSSPGSLEVIYVEGRSSAPSGWNSEWNAADVPVEWNA